ncbi:MAG: PKD domain-containing protein, partial [Desulfobacterales bacterium]|nr:PKD domain-containing protein [Desulfobacterales bacterium]
MKNIAVSRKKTTAFPLILVAIITVSATVFSAIPSLADLSFDGVDDIVDVGDLNAIDSANAYTVEARVRFDGFGSWATAFGKRVSDGNRTVILQAFSGSGAVGVAVNNGYGYSSTTLSAGVWYHLAIVFSGAGAADADRLKLYVDGAPETLSFLGVVPSSTPASDSRFVIGAEYNGTTPYNGSGAGAFFNGAIDELRIWNYARSSSQINTDKDSTLTGNEGGLLALYRDNSATTVTDLAGGDDNGIFFGENYPPEITQGDAIGRTMSEDSSPTSFSLTLNAADPNPGDALTWSISSAASHGGAVASGTGASKTIGYTPDANYNDADSFVVRVCDAGPLCDAITVNVTISPRNDPPVNTAPPTFSGVMIPGLSLNATSAGAWNDNTDTDVSGSSTITAPTGYQWQRADDGSGANLSDIAGATSGEYVLTSADEEKYVRLKITVEDDGVGLPATQSAEAFSVYNRVPRTVSFTSASQSGVENTGTMTITAELSGVSSFNVDVPFSIGGSATGGGTDYAITASPVVIPAGATAGAVTITVNDDALDENDETVIVTMGAPTNANQGATTVHTATITDNDDPPAVVFTSASQSGAENVGAMTITAQLSTPSGLSVDVPFTAGGAATGGGTDYAIMASPIAIAAGATAGAVAITVNDDALDENDETVIVTMGSPVNATPGATAVHTATITDNDDPPAVSFTSASQTGAEIVGVMTVAAQLSAVSALDVTLPFTVGGTATAGAGSDYTITASPVVIAAGATTGAITITVNDDGLDENDETVTVTMGSPVNATPGAITGSTTTITDSSDAPAVSFTQASQSGDEDGGDMAITALLSAASGLDVTIPLTLGGDADPGADYSISPNPAVIAAGATSQIITITVNDDLLDEVDETVIVTMGAPTNAAHGAISVHTAAIVDNETTPVADAGPDHAADMETRVDLDGSGSSDGDNRIVIFRWSQIGGEPVQIDNVHLEKTFFTAPRVDTDQTFASQLVFRLEVEDVDGLTDSDEVAITVLHISPPEASFDAAPLTGAPPLETAFTDRSAGEITEWRWDFGDGEESADQNPTHTYDEAGAYTAVLTVTGPGGEDSFSRVIEVIHPAPAVDFTAAPASGPSPLSVTFSSEIEGEVDSLVWDFGDGSGSTDENPTHLYEDFGKFTVKLTAVGPGGESAEEKTEYIEVVERFISGRVTTLSEGRRLVGLENCRVEVYSADGPEGDAITAADGSFSIGRLPGIDGMTALALPPAGSKEYEHQYYNMKKERVEADAVSTIGGDLVDVDFILDRIPDLGIDGRVMDKDGPLAGARVNIYSASAQSGATVESDANGEYAAPNLQAADDYRISVRSDALETTFFYAIPSGAPGDGAPSYSV